MKAKRIKLSGGRTALVDAWAFKIFGDMGWWFHKSSGYAAIKIKGKFTVLHSLIMLSSGEDGMCVDHINRNRLDNRTCNLRIVPKALNAVNVTTRNKVRGTHFHKRNQRWVAHVGKTPKVYLGSFGSQKEAAMAYNVAAKARWGELAVLNNIRSIKK